MTRNLYLGADLAPVIQALVAASQGGDPTQVVIAATSTWNAVKATKPEDRMAAIADEIVAERPAVVGLQEVTRWTTYSATGTPTVAFDFLDLLLDALADRGVVYHEVAGASADNFASPAIPVLPSTGVAAVSMSDRDVILRRDDVTTSNPHTGQFTNIIRFPVPGGVLPVKRGWGSVDVQTKLAEFRFVNSHLEAFSIPGVPAESIRVAQVQELLAAQAAITAASGDLPTIYVGDYNSDAPTGPAYQLLVSSVGSDAWLKTNPSDPGLTCCFDAAVNDPTDPLTSRIDLIVIDDEVKAGRAEVIGEEVGDMTPSGLWPSDHAGVVARLVVGATPTR